MCLINLELDLCVKEFNTIHKRGKLTYRGLKFVLFFQGKYDAVYINKPNIERCAVVNLLIEPVHNLHVPVRLQLYTNLYFDCEVQGSYQEKLNISTKYC